MRQIAGILLTFFALGVPPALANDDIYDGPTAIRPLTVIPKPPKFVPPPGQICDFEHNCFSDHVESRPTPDMSGTTQNLPPIVVRPAPSAPPAPLEAPVVSQWRSCIARALHAYSQSRDVDGLKDATAACQQQLESTTDSDAADEETNATAAVPSPSRRERDIGCGFWPVGSDADRACAAGRF